MKAFSLPGVKRKPKVKPVQPKTDEFVSDAARRQRVNQTARERRLNDGWLDRSGQWLK